MKKHDTQKNQITCPKCEHSFHFTDGLDRMYEEEMESKIRQSLEAEKQSEISDAVAAAVIEKNAASIEKLQKEKERCLDMQMQLQSLKSEIKMAETENKQKVEAAVLDAISKAKNEIVTKKDMEIQEFRLEKQRLLSQIDALNKTSNQAPVELQGEATEIYIEEKLRRFFADDIVRDIPKGTKGADCLLCVQERGNEAGTILFESKNTKTFQKSWIKKLKKDQADASANFAVIVTTAWPKDAESEGMHIYEGVYICRQYELLAVAALLRDSTVRLAAANHMQTQREEVQDRLFSYFTSTKFELDMRHTFEPIDELKKSLAKEKRSKELEFRKRQQHLEQMEMAAVGMLGNLRGISKEVPVLDFLELPFEK